MSVFLEKFVLTALSAALIAVVLTNPMNFDITQRITLGVAIIALAIFAAHTLTRAKVTEASAASPTNEVPPPMPPPPIKAPASSPQSTPPITINGDNAVVSTGQMGGITAQTVIINPPQISTQAKLLAVGGESIQQLKDGKYFTIFPVRLETPFPVSNLYIEVHGNTITQLEVAPERSGVFVTGNSGNRPGFSFTNIPNASGRYTLKIWSTQQEQFSIAYNAE